MNYTDNAWNGGGKGSWDFGDDEYASGGGGATDARIVAGVWDSADGLRSRIMTAGAGGGQRHRFLSAWGGGLEGAICNIYSTNSKCLEYETVDGAIPSTQNSGYAFGFGQDGLYAYSNTDQPGGGGGWYGGVAFSYGISGRIVGGGSSYISGHTGSVAVTSKTDSSPKAGCNTGTTDRSCSISPYGYEFTNTVMIDGAGYAWTNQKGDLEKMPNPEGGYYELGQGHSGNGYVRITYLGASN